MEDSLAKASASHIFGGKARIVDRRLIRVNRCTGRVQDNDRLRYGIRNPPKFAFILTQFLLSLLEVFDVGAYAYHMSIFPVSSRNGSKRIRNQRKTPSWRRMRASMSPGSPERNSSRHLSMSDG